MYMVLPPPLPYWKHYYIDRNSKRMLEIKDYYIIDIVKLLLLYYSYYYYYVCSVHTDIVITGRDMENNLRIYTERSSSPSHNQVRFILLQIYLLKKNKWILSNDQDFKHSRIQIFAFHNSIYLGTFHILKISPFF